MGADQKILVALDPGQSGCAAVRHLDSYTPDLYRFSHPQEKQALVSFLRDWHQDSMSVLLERVWARQGIHSSGRMMEAYGWLLGLIDAFDLQERTEIMTPQKWQKLCGLSYPKGSDYSQRKRICRDTARAEWGELISPAKITLKTGDSLMILTSLMNLEGLKNHVD